MNVFGTFRPVTSNYYGCALQDGATLDLSGWTGAWPWSVTSAFATGSNTVSFAENATITVKFGERIPSGRVVAWANDTKPPESVMFQRDAAETRKYSLRREADGLYVRRGFMLIVR